MMKRIKRFLRPSVPAFLALTAILIGPSSSTGHEIPNRVTVQTYIRPAGDVLRMLVRVPLNSMRDIQFPLRGPGYLELGEVQPFLFDAAQLWIVDYVQLYEDGELLRNPEVTGARISLPSDRSFVSYEEALANIEGPPIPESTDLYWEQAMLDVVIEYPIDSANSDFSIFPELAHLGLTTLTVLRFDLPGAAERVYQFTGSPGMVELDPRWHQAARRFIELGFFHILEGIDHLLFIFCLILPFRRLGPLITLVTSFTVAHSITLGISALGWAPNSLWFPPLVETLIAASILFMAFENIAGAKLKRRWTFAFGFGLIHGFGFSFLLRESLQFAGGHLTASLLAFNLGVELGQIVVLLIAVPALGLLFRYGMSERMGNLLFSALIAHTAWHWMADRWANVRAFDFQWPVMDTAFLLSSMRWTMAILILIGLLWLMNELFGRIRWLGDESLSGEAAPPAKAKG